MTRPKLKVGNWVVLLHHLKTLSHFRSRKGKKGNTILAILGFATIPCLFRLRKEKKTFQAQKLLRTLKSLNLYKREY